MEVYTIGFARKTAREFFGALKRAGIKQLLDVRLNNTSQLAGFTKREDLAFFLTEICGAAYRHELLLAPTQEMLTAFGKRKRDWPEYETRFLALLAERHVETQLDRKLFETSTVLLCSEATPEHCHRRLVAEYLERQWQNVTVNHL